MHSPGGQASNLGVRPVWELNPQPPGVRRSPSQLSCPARESCCTFRRTVAAFDDSRDPFLLRLWCISVARATDQALAVRTGWTR